MSAAYSITIFLKILGEHRRIQTLYDVHTLRIFVIAIKNRSYTRELVSSFSVFSSYDKRIAKQMHGGMYHFIEILDRSVNRPT